MGSWFARRYLERGLEVSVYDPVFERSRALAALGACISRRIDEVVKDAEAVLVAVPIASAANVVREVAAAMERGVVAEISSLKLPVIDGLRALPSEITPLSIHPLFGPSAPGFEGARFALIPVRDSEVEVEVARSLLSGAHIEVVSANEHDAAMAYILSLTHLVSLAAALAIPKDLTETLRRLGGASFSALVSMMSSTLSESPSTFTQLLTLNKDSSKVAERLIENLNELMEALKEEDREKIQDKLRNGVKVVQML